MSANAWRVRRSFAAAMLIAAAALALAHPGPAAAATRLLNPSLEADADANGVPDCWQQAGYGTNTYAFNRVTDAHAGTWGERVTVSSFTSGDRKLLSRLDSGNCAPAVTPGQSYVVGGWYKSDVPTFFVSYTRDATTGAWSYWHSGPQVPASSTWRYVTWTTPAIPSGAGNFSFGLDLNRAGSLTVDDFSFTPASTASPASSGTLSTTRPAGSSVLSDADAWSHVRLSSWEPRPDNAAPNGYKPTADELTSFRAATSEPYSSLVTGGATGTTDELIQWAAWKWGVDENVLRAVAVQESDWHQNELGDRRTEPVADYWENPEQARIASSLTATTGDVWQSLGITQVKWLPPDMNSYSGWDGTEPLRWKSTAFNLDFWGRSWRSCMDGKETWLGGSYAPGDEWGCVGLWYSGNWHDAGAENYISSVKQHLVNQDWLKF